MGHDDAVHAELRSINESLGYINGTLRSMDDRLDNVEGLYTKVQELEKVDAKNAGYVKGVAAVVACLFALVGTLAGIMIF